MKPAKAVWLALMLTGMLLSPGSLVNSIMAGSSSEHNKGEGTSGAAIDRYFDLEEKRDYKKIYGMLSYGFRSRLRGESKVHNEDDYERLRFSSESKWHNFKISGMKREAADRMKYMVHVDIEESGETERVEVTYRLVREENQWKLDQCEY